MPKAASHRARQWDEGKPLSFAWFDCASPDARRIYQTCNDDSRRASLRLDMQSQVLDDLVSGKLVAWDFQEGASLEQGPTLIPAHLFPRDAEDTAVADWRKSTLKASDFLFDRIRVTKPRAGTPRKKRVWGPTSGGTNPSPPPIAIPAPTPIISQSSKKRGRPRVDAPLRSVVRSLVDSGQLKDKSPRKPSPIRPVAPFSRNICEAAETAFDRGTDKRVEPDSLITYSEALAQYHLRPEAKFLNGEHSDRGRTERRHVIAVQILHIGKEANKWEEQYFLSPDDEAEIEYGDGQTADALDLSLRELCRELGEREAARKLEISRTALRRGMKLGVKAMSRAIRDRMAARLMEGRGEWVTMGDFHAV
jgi:hypothetical protein